MSLTLEQVWSQREAAVDQILKMDRIKDFDDDISDLSDVGYDLCAEITTLPIAEKKVPKKNTSRNKRIVYHHQIPVMTSDQVPLTPFKAGNYTVMKMGTIVNDNRWYNEKHIFPKGYAVKRSYQSTVDPQRSTQYLCSIEERDGQPYYVVRAEDTLEVFEGKSSNSAWLQIGTKASAIRNSKLRSIAGMEYYGLNQALINYCINNLPGVDELKSYTKPTFQLMSQAPKRSRSDLNTYSGNTTPEKSSSLEQISKYSTTNFPL